MKAFQDFETLKKWEHYMIGKECVLYSIIMRWWNFKIIRNKSEIKCMQDGNFLAALELRIELLIFEVEE